MADAHATVFQFSTIGALLEGHYDGGLTFTRLRTGGDFGIGTLDALDGEMVAIDGSFYQVKADGRVYTVPDTATTPFAVVTFFRPAARVALEEPLDFAGLTALLDHGHVDENLPYAVRVDGRFTSVKARSIPRQRKPYPRLVDVTARQPTFVLTNVVGTLVGFRFPGYMAGLNVAGYHFHFLSADRTSGGHVLAFQLESGVVAVNELSGVSLRLPTDSNFRRLRLVHDIVAEVETAERDSASGTTHTPAPGLTHRERD